MFMSTVVDRDSPRFSPVGYAFLPFIITPLMLRKQQISGTILSTAVICYNRRNEIF